MGASHPSYFVLDGTKGRCTAGAHLVHGWRLEQGGRREGAVKHGSRKRRCFPVDSHQECGSKSS
jgi:hypothetical protein